MRSKFLRPFVPLMFLLSAFFVLPSTGRAATGCTYPTTLDTFADVTSSQTLTIILYNKLQCAIEKAEAELGTLPKGTYADVKTRLDDAVYKVGNQTIAGVKTFSDVITSALGTITADKQNISATTTWNAAAVTFTALKLNIINTASAAASLLIDLQVDSVSKFKVDKTGLITASLSGNATTATALATNPADCGANTFAQSIVASGDLTCAAVNVGTADVTGTLPLTRGGTGQTTALAAFNSLSPLTTLGDVLYNDGTDDVRLAGNITTTKKFLRQTGTGAVSAAPAWDTLVAGDLPSHNHAAADINSGLLALARGGLNTDISAGGLLGDLLYANAATTFARLAGNVTTSKKILMQTGTGAVSAAPSWSLIDTMALFDTGLCTDGQIPKKAAGIWTCATDATAGSPTWDTVANPAADQALSMSTTKTTWTWSAATGASNLFNVKDTDNNTGTGYLVSINTQAGSAVKPFRLTGTGTVNGVEMTTAGGLQAIGTGTITANRTPCTGTNYLKFDGTCAAVAGITWDTIANPGANQSLTMAAFKTTFTFNDTTGVVVDLFTWTDTINNTGTGVMGKFTTKSGSSLNPFQADANGAGFKVNAGGQLVMVGAGEINAPKFSGTVTGTYTLGGTPTIGAVALGGTVSGGGQQLNNIIIGTSTPLAGYFTRLFAGGTDPGWTGNVFQVGTTGALSNTTSDAQTNLTFNTYFVTSLPKYSTSSSAALIRLDNTPQVSFQFASTGIAGNNITFVSEFAVTQNGTTQGNPTGGFVGSGYINVAGGIKLNNTAYNNPDYVLEHWATGRIVQFADRDGAKEYRGRRSLLELEQFTKDHYTLPLVYEARERHGNKFDIFRGGDAVLASIEEAYLYLIDHENRLKRLEAQYEK